jgi:hypothetical protein
MRWRRKEVKNFVLQETLCRARIVTTFGSPSPGTRKHLVLSEKEFKDRYRGNLSRNVLLIQSKAKVHLTNGIMSRLEKEPRIECPDTSSFNQGLQI